jgi:hopanoid biosynthesis associated radical SAM protein HpnH
MLEPLFRCNLACAGCGKIQYPAHILKRQLTPEECFSAVDECGAPMVSIPGGEPLLHPQIDRIVEGLIDRKKYVYLCSNALLLKEKIGMFKPSKYLTLSIHLDGQREHHDFSVCREGGYDLAVEGIREAVRRGFRVTTNTTLFDGADPQSVRAFFDEMMELGVEGMMLSPGYSYDKAPDQQHFLGKEKTRSLFRLILSNRRKNWRFNQSPLFLEFLMGLRHYACTPWGMPTYNLFGWQKPCYLLQDGYVDSFAELMGETTWDKYGTESGNPRCANCMVHSGYEASAVNDTFFSLRGFLSTIRATLFGGTYADGEALAALGNRRRGAQPERPGKSLKLESVNRPDKTVHQPRIHTGSI